MKSIFSVRLALIACAALLILTSCSSLSSLIAKAPPQPARRILFIGNSFTSFNGGLDQQLAGLDPSSQTARIAVDGATLQVHWSDGKALEAIRTGGWNYDVLQEQSQMPILAPGQFRDFAGQFDSAIKSSRAKTVLLMTWERPDSISQGVTTANLANAFTSVGQNLGIQVAPAGLAFERSLGSRPDLVLYAQDGHPTLYGTFLAACVLYTTILGKSPVGNTFSVNGIPPDTRAYFQRIAAETLAIQ